ncbi:MAG: transcription elongation factor GreA [Bacilli bacterium]
MTKEIVYLTEEKKKEFEDELHHLKFVKRDEVIKELQEARAQGDLSENADYAAAREEQSFVEGRIKELEAYLDNVEIIEEDSKKDIIVIGSIVKILDIEMEEEMIFRIVGSQESDPDSGKISNNSPIAKALLGKKVGNVVNVEAPNNEYEIKILEIE